ncbi:MAG: hypothetical protein IT478_11055 [Xanthomonadales bacterium]|nr:hypothetical protein [Xanthomonadales bacterium]
MPMGRWYLAGIALFVAMASRAEAPFSVGVLVDGGWVWPPTFVVAKLRAGEPQPLLQRALEGRGNVVVSRDRRRVFVVSSRPDQSRRLEVLDAADFRVLRSVILQPPFAWFVGELMAELPTDPDVLMISRCWWIDTRSGALIETPESLGVRCPQGANTDGLSASGRYLLLDEMDATGGLLRTVLVDPAQPRAHLRVLPARAGPILEDDSAVAVDRGDHIELHPIQGNGAPQSLPLPPQVPYLTLLGAHRGGLYGLGYAPATGRNAIHRFDRASAQWSILVERIEYDMEFEADFHGRWALFSFPTSEWCWVGCGYSSSNRVLLNTDTGAIVRTYWDWGGLDSSGAALLGSGPVVPVDLFANRAMPLLLIGFLLVTARAAIGGRTG